MSSHRDPDRVGLPALQRALVGAALAIVLLCAQTLGLWHRTEHVPASHEGRRAPTLAQPALDHASLVAQVFGHDAGESDACRLFDQLTLADSLLAVAVILPVVEPVVDFVAPGVVSVGRPEPAHYQARAPPAFG